MFRPSLKSLGSLPGPFFAGLLLAALLVGQLAFTVPAQGAVLRLDNQQSQYNLGPYVEAFAPDDPEMDLTRAASPAVAGRYRPLGGNEVHLEPGRPLWLRLRLAAPPGGGPKDHRWLLSLDNSGIGWVELYRPARGAEGGYRVTRAGLLEPYSGREINSTGFVFRISVPAGTTRTFYLRLKSFGSLSIPVKLWRTWAFGRYAQLSLLAFGLFYGSLLSMFMFNVFVYVSLRDPAYLRYVLFILFVLLYLIMANGHHMVLMNINPDLALRLTYIFLGGMVVFANAFTRVFLSTTATLPRFDKVITVSMSAGWVIAGMAAFGLFQLADQTAQATGVLGPLVALTAGILRVAHGFRPAGYFLLAWSLFLISTIHYVLQDMGLVPVVLPGALGMTLGSAVESVLLSFALADRIRLLRQEKEDLAQSRMRYRTASLTDGLTGLYNLRYMRERLGREAEDAGRLGHPLSVVMMDVDDFKSFNDDYGHQLGDQVLTRLAAILLSSARTSDAACRYGGEEFVLILPGTELDQAGEVAERIRREFAGQEFTAENSPSMKATISGGVAQLRVAEKPDDLLKRADQALYQAKSKGKNRVEAHR